MKNKIKKIKAVLTDCDGVLTNGGMYYTESGDEFKRFNTRDGMAFKILNESGYLTGVITGENAKSVENRAKKLHMEVVYLGVIDKLKTCKEICEKYELKLSEIAYFGDDINDLELLKHVGFSIAPKDAEKIIKRDVDYITKAKGGEGVIREVVNKFFSKGL